VSEEYTMSTLIPEHTTPLYRWARRHGITPQALADLLSVLGAGEPPVIITARQTADNESAVVQERRLLAAREGRRLWRNNTGAVTAEGRMVRFGLGNDSAAVNRVMKSSDLIGITPVVCDCGKRYGVFTAEECKRPGWKFTGTEREQAQLNFISLVTALGGIAKFTTGE
jgi:hypothetical protein